MFSYQQQGSSISGPAHFFLSSPPPLVIYSSSQPSDHKPFSGRGLRLHMHTQKQTHRCIYVHAHIDMPTNTWDTKSVHAQKQKCRHTHRFLHNCILWFVTMRWKYTGIRGFGGLGGTERKERRVGDGKLEKTLKERQKQAEIVRRNEG